MPVPGSAPLSSRWQVHPQVGREVVAQFQGSHLCGTGQREFPSKLPLKVGGIFPRAPVSSPSPGPAGRVSSFIDRRKGVGYLAWPDPTGTHLEREPSRRAGTGGSREATLLLAANILCGLREGCGHFPSGRIVGLLLPVSYCTTLRDTDRPESQNWNCQHRPLCVFIEPENPSDHIIPKNANFVLHEFFGLKNQINYNIITSDYVGKYTTSDQGRSIKMNGQRAQT